MEKKLPKVPVPPQVFADDVTAEKFAELLSTHHERMALISAEGGIFETMAGRYNGGTPNIDCYLKSHAGDPLRVDRKNSKQSINLQEPSSVFGLSVQPDVLHGMISKPGFAGRGLLARFLYLTPITKVGYREIKSPSLDMKAVNSYHSCLASILDIEPPVDKETGRVRPYVLKFSKNAIDKYYEYAQEAETWLRQGGRFEHMKKWGNKFTGATVRLSGNFHVAEHPQPWEKEISVDTLERAIRFMDVVADHSTAAFDQMGENAVMERARAIWNWVVQKKRLTFTNRDIQQSLKKKYKTWALIKEGIDILIERDYLRDPAHGKTRKKMYEVNPLALK